MSKKRKNEGMKKVLMVIIQLVVGFIVGLISATLFLKYADDTATNNFLGPFNWIVKLIIYVIIMYAMFLLQIILHEAGHLIMGLLSGYSFVSFRVGSITLIREDGKWKLKKFAIPGTAGQCLMAPPKSMEHFPYKLYNYGGVLMNILLVLIAIVVLLLFPNAHWLLKVSLVIMAFSGVFTAITNGIPMKLAGVPNDALNIKCMNRDPLARKAFYKQLDINAKSTKGFSMKDLDADYFKLPEDADLSNVIIAYIKIMEASRYMELRDFDAARGCFKDFEPIFEKLPALLQNMLRLEMLFLELVKENEEPDIDRYLTKDVKNLLKLSKYDMNAKRIDYAYQLLHLKDENAAEKCYMSANKLSLKYAIRGEAESNLSLIEYVRNLSLAAAKEETTL